jgi:hypothetical protein
LTKTKPTIQERKKSKLESMRKMYQMKEEEKGIEETQAPVHTELSSKIVENTVVDSYLPNQNNIEEITEVLIEKVHDVPPEEEVDELLHWSTQLDENAIAI